jgi:hypothetical protein
MGQIKGDASGTDLMSIQDGQLLTTEERVMVIHSYLFVITSPNA